MASPTLRKLLIGVVSTFGTYVSFKVFHLGTGVERPQSNDFGFQATESLTSHMNEIFRFQTTKSFKSKPTESFTSRPIEQINVCPIAKSDSEPIGIFDIHMTDSDYFKTVNSVLGPTSCTQSQPQPTLAINDALVGSVTDNMRSPKTKAGDSSYSFVFSHIQEAVVSLILSLIFSWVANRVLIAYRRFRGIEDKFYVVNAKEVISQQAKQIEQYQTLFDLRQRLKTEEAPADEAGSATDPTSLQTTDIEVIHEIATEHSSKFSELERDLKAVKDDLSTTTSRLQLATDNTKNHVVGAVKQQIQDRRDVNLKMSIWTENIQQEKEKCEAREKSHEDQILEAQRVHEVDRVLHEKELTKLKDIVRTQAWDLKAQSAVIEQQHEALRIQNERHARQIEEVQKNIVARRQEDDVKFRELINEQWASKAAFSAMQKRFDDVLFNINADVVAAIDRTLNRELQPIYESKNMKSERNVVKLRLEALESERTSILRRQKYFEQAFPVALRRLEETVGSLERATKNERRRKSEAKKEAALAQAALTQESYAALDKDFLELLGAAPQSAAAPANTLPAQSKEIPGNDKTQPSKVEPGELISFSSPANVGVGIEEHGLLQLGLDVNLDALVGLAPRLLGETGPDPAAIPLPDSPGGVQDGQSADSSGVYGSDPASIPLPSSPGGVQDGQSADTSAAQATPSRSAPTGSTQAQGGTTSPKEAVPASVTGQDKDLAKSTVETGKGEASQAQQTLLGSSTMQLPTPMTPRAHGVPEERSAPPRFKGIKDSMHASVEKPQQEAVPASNTDPRLLEDNTYEDVRLAMRDAMPKNRPKRGIPYMFKSQTVKK